MPCLAETGKEKCVVLHHTQKIELFKSRPSLNRNCAPPSGWIWMNFFLKVSLTLVLCPIGAPVLNLNV